MSKKNKKIIELVEGQSYSKLDFNNELLKILSDNNILTHQKPKEEVEISSTSCNDEETIEEIPENYYTNFVGLVFIDDYIIKCYPKFLFENNIETTNSNFEINNDKKTEVLQKVLKTLDVYSRKHKEENIKFTDVYGDTNCNWLSVILFLLRDYYENDIYINTKTILEENGNGKVDWHRTINNTLALIKDNIPYYMHIKTKKTVTNDYDFFKRLHEAILTQASQMVKEYDLDELIQEIVPVTLSNEKIEDIGSKDYLIYKIEQELNVEFNTRKKEVLHNMKMFIEEQYQNNENNCLTLYGTKSYDKIWEDMVNNMFCNVNVSDFYVSSEFNGPNNFAKNKECLGQLQPDTIMELDNDIFVIDAKYYKYRYLPSTSDSQKQITYAEYVDKTTKFTSHKIYNTYILPKYNSDIDFEIVGYITVDYKNNEKNYHKIWCTYLDVDTAINSYISLLKEDLKGQLATEIINSFEIATAKASQ